jgi:hypothetical protein
MIVAWQFTAWKECKKRGPSQRDGMRGSVRRIFRATRNLRIEMILSLRRADSIIPCLRHESVIEPITGSKLPGYDGSVPTGQVRQAPMGQN